MFKIRFKTAVDCFHFCKNKTNQKTPPKSHKQKTQNYIWAVSRLDPALDDIAACPLKGLWNPLISYSFWRCPLKILFCHLLKLTVPMQEEGLPKIIFFHISFLLGSLCTPKSGIACLEYSVTTMSLMPIPASASFLHGSLALLHWIQFLFCFLLEPHLTSQPETQWQVYLCGYLINAHLSLDALKDHILHYSFKGKCGGSTAVVHLNKGYSWIRGQLWEGMKFGGICILVQWERGERGEEVIFSDHRD